MSSNIVFLLKFSGIAMSLKQVLKFSIKFFGVLKGAEVVCVLCKIFKESQLEAACL